MTKESLIRELVSGGHLKTPILIEAFELIDRADFVPPELKDKAYNNEPLPIGFGQTISQPLTVAFMLELLSPQPDEKILDVGAGSGWQTAILAYIVSKKVRDAREAAIHPKVMAIERIPELKEMAESNVGKYGFLSSGIVSIILGDATEGVPKNLLPVGGFDKIIAAASASGDIPLAWKRQLAVGGRIVAPVGERIVVFRKKGKDAFVKDEYSGFAFVPLVSGRM